ncbi:trehalose-6-phosphate synthase [Haladaptatus sp. R4]|uniref:alpha,alpha-trehalose-phosphate synthase (UDP-forming) n=1 Tax=Haladaptatus sp. R4 TaxID=1679489 RepID=UPI0007B46FE6|nr:trehalose-6-phosphate synthase [Haladaptatus sp. R4]KZN23115.1 trehalose-6-phosphate synthase [Haladaptatus sp. R4]
MVHSQTNGDDAARSHRDPASILQKDLIVVSNRQPYQHRYEEDGRIEVDRPAGGLTAAIDPVMQQTDGTWVAWGDGEADAEVTADDGTIRLPPEDETYTLKRIWLSEEEVDGYYYGYSNQTLWPLCHGGVWKPEYESRHWARYQQINERFASAVAEHAASNSLVWFQDYHFALAPRQLRNGDDSAFIMHFWHIPWPSWETFQACPQQRELLDGLLGNDLLGFHIERYCENFLTCVDRCLDDAFIDREDGQVRYDGRTTTVRAFPLGINADDIQAASESIDGSFWQSFQRDHSITPSTRVVAGVDRLDYTKGIVDRLNALERLWTTNPDWREEFTYVQKANESRSLIPDYQDLQQDVEDAVTRINDRFGTNDWQPVVYIEDWMTDEELAGLYRHSDALLVSAVRDGMNLVAKEYVAAQTGDPGVLVLSNQTGAHEELGDQAVTINPHETDTFAAAITTALTMKESERRDRMETLRHRVRANDLSAWMTTVFETARDLQ